NGGGDGVVGRGRPGQEGVGLAGLDGVHLVDHLDGDGLVGAALHAGGGLAHRQPVAAHVALADDPLLGAVLGGVVRAHQGAVLAADALVVEVADDAGHRILLVALHRAAGHAGGIDAVVTRGGDRLLGGRLRGAAVEQPHRP